MLEPNNTCFISMIETTTEIMKVDDPAPIGRFKVSDYDYRLPENDFVVKSTRSFVSDFEAMKALSNLSKSLKSDDPALFIMHRRPVYQQEKTIQLVTVHRTKGVSYKTVLNPHWSGLGGVLRNVSSPTIEQDISVALQSQLFAMLDMTKGDAKWMSEFSLKDYQQQDVYEWQRSFLPRGNLISAEKMASLMKNVLNVVRLPWIKLIFKDKGDACCFRVRLNNKSANPEVVATASDMESVNWLHEQNPALWEKVGHFDTSDKLKIEKMELEFVTSWGMNPYILLHELGHYLAFCLPLKTKLNRGKWRLSYKEYEVLFAGHGALYMGVFRYLLINFGRVDQAWLDGTLTQSRVKYINIENLDVENIDDTVLDFAKTKLK